MLGFSFMCSQMTFTTPSRAQLRKTLREQRQALSPIAQKKAAQHFLKQFVKSSLFHRHQRIAMYLANDGELNLQPTIDYALACGKKVYLPVLNTWPKTHMAFQQIVANQVWEKNRFNIVQPKINQHLQVKPWALDLVLLPLVGFDKTGGRLGMGGGFYDRHFAYLAQRKVWKKPVLVGIAHACQELESIPVQSWDIPLNEVFIALPT